MFKHLLLLMLMASVHCQIPVSKEVQATIDSIFGKPRTGGNTQTEAPAVNKRQGTTTSATSAPSSINNSKEVPCVMEDGSSGVCVPYYLCDSDTNQVKTDGEGILDIRFGDGESSAQQPACGSYLHMCCALGNKRPDEDPITPSPEPERQGCGWSNPKGADMRTTGETAGETKFGEFPWMVAVVKSMYSNNQKFEIYVGGGSLIHPSVVLTAAHTVFNAETLKIRVGEWDTQTDDEIHPHQDRDVASKEIHKDFRKGVLFYDAALLFLTTPVVLARHIGVVCLPPPRQRMLASTRCVATGWGKDKFGKEGKYQVIMKKIELPVVEHNACQTAFRSTRLGRLFQLHSSFMCAGGEKDKDTCKGDGGSPLSCPIEYEKDRYVQSGIVAWGIGCGGDGIPGAYVDVAMVRDWIDDKMAGKGYSTSIYTY